VAERAEELGRPEIVTAAADIEEITRTLWATLFDLPLVRVSAASIPPGETVTACVQIVGAWRGAVVLRCSLPLARVLSEQMFQADEPLTLAELRDAIGELANVIGGNVKALFPGPSQISLPAVAVGTDYEFGVVEAGAATDVPFTCGGMPLQVTLYQALTEIEDRGG
jgi:chemotaxis protein CheX